MAPPQSDRKRLMGYDGPSSKLHAAVYDAKPIAPRRRSWTRMLLLSLAALRQAQATVARDQAQLASAQADADRAVMLADRGIVSAQQRDQLVANAKALAATIDADKAAVERASLNLGYTTIRAPVNGKTG